MFVIVIEGVSGRVFMVVSDSSVVGGESVVTGCMASRNLVINYLLPLYQNNYGNMGIILLPGNYRVN